MTADPVTLQAHQKLLFIGDSITDAGRLDTPDGLGQGYVKMLHDLLQAAAPDLKLSILNRGVGGHTSRDLAARWERDALSEAPDLLSVKIGVNDVWRAFDGHPEQAVPLPEYESTLRTLLGQAQAGGIRLVLITPFLIEPDVTDPMRLEVTRYARVVRQLAAEFGEVLVDLQARFDAAVAATGPLAWAADRVHPTSVGHTLIALEWLRAVGFSPI